MAGAVTAVLFMLFYLIHGYYPFGERSAAWCDMDQQYVPLLMELKTAFSDGSLLLGRGGGVMSFYGVFLFFLSSPLSLISLAVDNSHMIWFVNILIVIKAGLSAASAEFYFRRMLPRLNVPMGVLMSVMYGTSGYVMLYYQNNMWLDMMTVFPLLLTALFRLIRSGKWGAYALCLAMCVIMNFYISFMVIVFIAMLGGAALYLCCEPDDRGSRALRLLVLGACTGPSSVFFHREEVAVQFRGVTAGAEVHGCLGVTGGLQRKRDVLSAWSGDSVPVGHISFLRGGRPS